MEFHLDEKTGLEIVTVREQESNNKILNCVQQIAGHEPNLKSCLHYISPQFEGEGDTCHLADYPSMQNHDNGKPVQF